MPLIVKPPLVELSNITISSPSAISVLTPAAYFILLAWLPLFLPTNFQKVGLALASLSIDNPKANKPAKEASFFPASKFNNF